MPNSKDWNNWNKAIWQYLLDHATVTRTGKYRVVMTVKDPDTLFMRVKARYRGEFHRNDIRAMQNIANKEEAKYNLYSSVKKYQDRKAQEVMKFAESKNLLNRAIRKSIRFFLWWRAKRINKLLK